MNILEKNILITGASGSLGQQLLYDLYRKGCHPVAHVRETSDTTFIDSLKLKKRIADLRLKDQVTALVEGIDAIIHTAAWVNFRQDRLTQFTGINTFGAMDLFKAAQKAGVKRFIHVSTVAAVGAVPKQSNNSNDTFDAPVKATERDNFNLGHLRIPYIMTKQAAETELLKLAPEGPTELIIVNPSIIVAPSRTGDDRRKATKAFSRLVIPVFPNFVNLVDIRDVSPAIITALEKGHSGERYILAGDNITIRELVLEVSTLLGKAPHLVKIPRPVLRSSARFAVIYNKLLGRGKVSYYPDLVKMLDYDWAYSSMKARRELGYNNRPLHVTLKDLLTDSFVGTFLKPTS